ncbi:MAG: hypothetical protein V2I33_13095 [Kangiellaceae bacterium]|jgi:hypothetical protein|nr:hypothetical protein [Kangiellaceae bacterium]
MILSLMFLITSQTEFNDVANIQNIDSYYELCMSNDAYQQVTMFDGVVWIPSAFSLNLKLSKEQGKIAYTTSCFVYNEYFRASSKKKYDFEYASIFILDIKDCGECSESIDNERFIVLNQQSYKGITIREIAFKSVKSTSYVVAYKGKTAIKYHNVDRQVVINTLQKSVL